MLDIKENLDVRQGDSLTKLHSVLVNQYIHLIR